MRAKPPAREHRNPAILRTVGVDDVESLALTERAKTPAITPDRSEAKAPTQFQLIEGLEPAFSRPLAQHTTLRPRDPDLVSQFAELQALGQDTVRLAAPIMVHISMQDLKLG